MRLGMQALISKLVGNGRATTSRRGDFRKAAPLLNSKDTFFSYYVDAQQPKRLVQIKVFSSSCNLPHCQSLYSCVTKLHVMIYFTIALFALAALFGLLILIKWLTHKEASKTVIYSHGIIAAAALVLLVVFALQNPDNYPKVSIGLFVISALFGFYMFFRDLMKKFSPMSVAFIHALLAVSGFGALLAFAFIK
jgi:hypothetical protein